MRILFCFLFTSIYASQRSPLYLQPKYTQSAPSSPIQPYIKKLLDEAKDLTIITKVNEFYAAETHVIRMHRRSNSHPHFAPIKEKK